MSTEQIAQGLHKAPPARLVVDFETVSGWHALPAEVRAAYLRKHREAELRKPRECRGRLEDYPPAKASTNPWTGQVVCIALYDPIGHTGQCFYWEQPKWHDGDDNNLLVTDGWRFEGVRDERALLETFWRVLARNPGARIESFNGRSFDGTYAFVRSYVHNVPCTLNLVPYRYSTREHLDLFDVLGAWERGRTPSLDVVCRTAGIESPKSGLTGAGVQQAWDEGRVLEIARYCAKDVMAEAEAVDRWDATVGKVFGGPRK